MTTVLDISIVLPVYNNAPILVELVQRLEAHLNAKNIEIILVNDGSKDQSQKVIDRLATEKKNIKSIRHKKNLGQHQATLSGLIMAQGKKIVVMDADLQDQPELILPLLNICTKTKQAAFVKRKGRYQNIMRMCTSFIIKRWVQYHAGLHRKAGSFYMFDRSILDIVIELATTCPQPYMSIIVAHVCESIVYIASVREKSIGSSNYTFSKRINAASKAIQCSTFCKKELLLLQSR